jgi:hypothetical protein
MAEPKKASKTFYPKYKSFSKLFKHNSHVNKYLSVNVIKFFIYIHFRKIVKYQLSNLSLRSVHTSKFFF